MAGAMAEPTSDMDIGLVLIWGGLCFYAVGVCEKIPSRLRRNDEEMTNALYNLM